MADLIETYGSCGPQDLARGANEIRMNCIDYIDIRGKYLRLLAENYEHWPYPVTGDAIRIYGPDAKTIAWWWWKNKTYKKLMGG